MKSQYRIVTDREADDSIKPLEALRVEVAEGLEDYFCASKINVAVNHSPTHKACALAAGEIKLLKAIVNSPMQPSSEYAKLARISPNTFQKVRPVLIEKGLIREQKLESGDRGRATILLEPLPKGIELVSAAGNGSGTGD